jgi:peptidoglycan hydrolase-like protein with peptidoglycan-binding domain
VTIALTPQTGTVGDQQFDARNWGRAAKLENIQQGETALMQGQGGESVAQLQQRLIDLGYLPKGSVDGRFGPTTRAALARAQKDNGLTADGILGKDSYARLFSDGAKQADPGPSRGSDAERERMREFVEARKDFTDLKDKDPWKDATANDPSTREARANAGIQRLDRLQATLGTLPPDQRAAAQQTIDKLRNLYGRLTGLYVAGAGARSDAANAKVLEDQLAREIPTGR